jgi:NADP-dependent 3-hydroxy acid dehydrogenase YdfG
VLALETGASELAERYGACAGQLLELVQSLAAADDEALLVSLVVPGTGAGRIWRALAGLLRSAAQENARLAVQLVSAGEAGLQVLRRSFDEVHRSTPAPLSKQGGVYLITGGLGGLGRIVAHAMAEQAQDITLVLTGRTAEPAGLAALAERLGGAVQLAYHALDVADEPAVEALVAGIRARYGRLDGVVHGAGVLRDVLALNQTAQQLQQVLAPKVRGTLALERATRGEALDYFITFSSTSGVFGNVGQAGYGARAQPVGQLAAMGRRRDAGGRRDAGAAVAQRRAGAVADGGRGAGAARSAGTGRGARGSDAWRCGPLAPAARATRRTGADIGAGAGSGAGYPPRRRRGR